MNEESSKQEKTDKIKSVFKNIFKYSDKINKILYIVILTVALSALRSLFQSSIEGDFILYQKDEKGRTEIGVIRAKKFSPPVHNKNLLTLKVDSDLTRTVSYQRNMYDVLGFQVFAGPSLGQNRYGAGVVGVAVSISF